MGFLVMELLYKNRNSATYNILYFLVIYFNNLERTKILCFKKKIVPFTHKYHQFTKKILMRLDGRNARQIRI